MRHNFTKLSSADQILRPFKIYAYQFYSHQVVSAQRDLFYEPQGPQQSDSVKPRSPMRVQTVTSLACRTIRSPNFQVRFSSMANKALPKFSEGEDGDRLMKETAALLESKWALDEAQQGLEKTFNFPTYAKALVGRSIPRRVGG